MGAFSGEEELLPILTLLLASLVQSMHEGLVSSFVHRPYPGAYEVVPSGESCFIS